MPKRMSSRDRMQRKAAEAEAAALEKAQKKKTTTKASGGTKTPSKRKSAEPVRKREKTVWKVFSNSYKEMAVFPFPEKDKADAEAARLAEKTGQTHFVNPAKVPMEDGE